MERKELVEVANSLNLNFKKNSPTKKRQELVDAKLASMNGHLEEKTPSVQLPKGRLHGRGGDPITGKPVLHGHK